MLERDQPLADMTVIELGQIVSGPMATIVLADLGADVVKVEQPKTGDRIRHGGDVGNAMFQSLNRNKRSIAIDLKSEEGRNLYRDLASDVDVIVENLAPGTADRLGVGYESLSVSNPQLIYLSVKGFCEGPYGNRAGMDVVGEAMSGFMRMTGQEGQKPLRAGTSVADFASAMYGIVGILLALRYRNTTGEGQKLTTGIFESLTHWMSYWITYAQLVGEDHPPLGASHPSQAVYDAFELADGEWVFVGVVSEGQWRDLCEILDRPDIFTDPRYETDESRLEHKTELLKAIAGELSQRNREKVLIELTDAGIPAAPVNAPSDLVNDPHLEELGMLVESQTSDGESTFRSLLTPISNEHVNPVNIHDPPQVGEHTEELLEQFGYDRAEREALRENSAVDY